MLTERRYAMSSETDEKMPVMCSICLSITYLAVARPAASSVRNRWSQYDEIGDRRAWISWSISSLLVVVGLPVPAVPLAAAVRAAIYYCCNAPSKY